VTPLAVITGPLRLFYPDTQPPSPPREARCAAPSCGRTARHRHHIVSRTKTNGPLDWIVIHNTETKKTWLVRNVVDLCPECHDKLESQPGGAKARLRFLDDNGFAWYRRAGEEDTDVARIWWYDDILRSPWVFRGFLKGDTWVQSLK
jgi:hypothetical protein